MRIALLDPPSYTPPYDHALASALGRRGHEVELLTAPFLFGPLPSSEGFRRRELFFARGAGLLRRAPRSRARLLLKGADYLPSVRRLLRAVEQLDPDVVHVQWLTLPRADVRWLRRITADRPTVFTAHTGLNRQGGASPLWREVLGAVDRVVVHSQRALEQLDGLGLEPGRVVRIPHPLFAAAGGSLPPLSGRTLLFFGLVRAYKGLDVLVRAFAQVARAVPDARLLVAGDAMEPVEDVRSLAGELGISDRVEWRLRFIREDEIAALMASVRVVVLPYRETDASGALATALGHGRPAVVTDVGALGETVREFGAGAVVPPGDHEALAAACIRLLTDDAALAAAVSGVEAARAALTWDEAALAHEQLYEEAIAGRR